MTTDAARYGGYSNVCNARGRRARHLIRRRGYGYGGRKYDLYHRSSRRYVRGAQVR